MYSLLARLKCLVYVLVANVHRPLSLFRVIEIGTNRKPICNFLYIQLYSLFKEQQPQNN